MRNVKTFPISKATEMNKFLVAYFAYLKDQNNLKIISANQNTFIRAFVKWLSQIINH